MKKTLVGIFALLLIFSCTQTSFAKTTFNASFRKHSLTVSDEKAQNLGVFVSDWLAPQIMPIIEMELMDDALDALVRVVNYNIMEIILRDDDNDSYPDILEYIGQTLSEALLADDNILINPILAAVKTTFITNTVDSIYGDSSVGSFIKLLTGDILKNVITSIYNGFEDDLEGLLRDFVANDLVIVINDNVIDLLSDVPKLLEDLILDEMPGVLSDVVYDEIPGLIENLVKDYSPRDLDIYVASLDFKSDITSLLALGASVKGIGFDTIFIPEISLALYFKLIENPTFNWSLLFNWQNMFTPGKLDNISAFNLGTSFTWQPLNRLVLDGEVTIGKFIGKPLADDTPNVIWNYTIGLGYNVTKNAHIKVSYSLRGIADLAIEYLERLLTNERNYGWFNFSAGFNF